MDTFRRFPEISVEQARATRDLRRTLARWAQEVNVPIAVVQSQLGHSSITTTARHYTSIDTDVQRAALEKTVASMIDAAM